MQSMCISSWCSICDAKKSAQCSTCNELVKQALHGAGSPVKSHHAHVKSVAGSITKCLHASGTFTVDHVFFNLLQHTKCLAGKASSFKIISCSYTGSAPPAPPTIPPIF